MFVRLADFGINKDDLRLEPPQRLGQPFAQLGLLTQLVFHHAQRLHHDLEVLDA